jgi:hypothetical protein
MKAASGYKFMKFARAVPAFGEGLVGKFLKGFFDLSALHAFILVDRHSNILL